MRIILSILICITACGCDEIYDDGSRPNSAIMSATYEGEDPDVRYYMDQAKVAREEQYQALKKPRARQLFSMKADQYDLISIQELRTGKFTNRVINTDFTAINDQRAVNNFAHSINNQPQYNPMQYKQGQYGDMYRLGQSIGNAGQAQMNWAIQNYEDEAQAQAINSLHAYFLKMDRIKIKLINDKHKK